MGSELINISYKGVGGESEIRTVQVENIVHVSLADVLKTLSKENKDLGEDNQNAAVPTVLRTVASTLEDDEYITRPVSEPRFEGETEIFVTHPGLYRVISVDKSKASRKFQKWLFHEVVPSIVKHGTYPPPPESKGSSLSQMAEMLAQNSRILADTINRQERLEDQVTDVQSQVGSIVQRLSFVESNGADPKMYITVSERLAKLGIDVTIDQETEIVAWCENINLSSGNKRIPCPSRERLRARYSVDVIDEAIENFQRISDIREE